MIWVPEADCLRPLWTNSLVYGCDRLLICKLPGKRHDQINVPFFGMWLNKIVTFASPGSVIPAVVELLFDITSPLFTGPA